MGKVEVVAAQLAVIQQAEVDALNEGLGACYDQGLADAGGAPGGFTQADIDAAVAAAQAVDAQALADAQAKAVSDLAALQVLLDDMTSKEQAEEKVVADLQASVDSVQSALDAIKALILPVPAPVV